jgi:cytochrome c oxidase subunit 3
MRWLIASLGMIFAASIVGTLWVRSHAKVWPPPGVPALPARLWISTLLIVASSAALEWAVRALRRNDAKRLRWGLALTLVLGLGFLSSQTVNWFLLAARAFVPTANLYAFTFYLLTCLHAAHVVGGVIPLSVVTVRAWGGRYSAASHAGVTFTAMYWHFLTVVWLVLFLVLAV